MEDDV